MAGYSPRSLIDKLGIKAGNRVAILNAPRSYRSTLGRLPTGVTVARTARGSFVFIQFFTRARTELRARLPVLSRSLRDDGALWVSWPKQASGVRTDVNEDTIRDLALPLGLVDVKVCAVDATWSGLKLVRRRERRTARPVPRP